MPTPITLLINGLPGQMAATVLHAAAGQPQKFRVIPWSLTGADVPSDSFIGPAGTVKLIPPPEAERRLEQLRDQYPGLIVVDYTHPLAVLPNGRLYLKQKIPFVMGTTGGDRDVLLAELEKAAHPCVVAPNMALPIVALQAMFEHIAERFSGVFKPFALRVRESHQAGKADTSGTAKALVTSFQQLGCEFSVEQIEKIRKPDAQIAMGVPAEHLPGHAYHTYSLESEALGMDLSFTHNVRGRSVYAAGTLVAVETLARWLAEGTCTGPRDMIAVLEDLQ